MGHKIQAQHWPLWWRVAVTASAVIIAYLVQIPLEHQVPGEPFLLFSLVVISATLAFGLQAGFIAVGLSTLLSFHFFEPRASFSLFHATDIIKIELYAIVGAGSAFAFSRLRQTLIALRETNKTLAQLDTSKSLLLRETAHGVANNFATVAALLSMRSASVGDIRAKRTLDEAVEQVKVMARVHRRLRARDQDVSLDSAAYICELCDDLEEMAYGRPIVIECEADSRPLRMQQAVLLGLILNELVTNAVKHAFPGGRAGRIRVRLEALDTRLRLSVEDDGVGFDRSSRSGADMGQGQALLLGLTHELEGNLEHQSTTSGSSFRLTFPADSGIGHTSTPGPASLGQRQTVGE
jgi:two-component system, sensor histidine kinase PdtaS